MLYPIMILTVLNYETSFWPHSSQCKVKKNNNKGLSQSGTCNNWQLIKNMQKGRGKGEGKK